MSVNLVDIVAELSNEARKATTGEFIESRIYGGAFNLIECDLKITEPDGTDYYYHYKEKTENAYDVEIKEILPVELCDPQESVFDDIFDEIKVYHMKKMFPNVPIEDICFAVYGDVKGAKLVKINKDFYINLESIIKKAIRL